MTLRLPFLSVIGPDGQNLVDRLRDEFIGVQITDLEGGESDELLIRMRRAKPYRLPPTPDSKFTVMVGWEQSSAQMTGAYLFKRVIYSGDPESGQEMGLVCRAPDIDALKWVDSEHFDAESGHKTYGDVFRTLADRAGLNASIAPSIADLALPGGYLLRWRQSAMGFATDLADELGAIVKPQAGNLTVRQLGSFAAPSGGELAAIVVPFDPGYAYTADIEPRFGFGSVVGSYFDGKTGRPADALRSLAGKAARLALPHIAGSADVANAIATGASIRLEGETATATFEMLGNPAAVAGAPVRPQGFGPDIDGVQWEASSVLHDIGPERGWVTTVEARSAGG